MIINWLTRQTRLLTKSNISSNYTWIILKPLENILTYEFKLGMQKIGCLNINQQTNKGTANDLFINGHFIAPKLQ